MAEAELTTQPAGKPPGGFHHAHNDRQIHESRAMENDIDQSIDLITSVIIRLGDVSAAGSEATDEEAAIIEAARDQLADIRYSLQELLQSS